MNLIPDSQAFGLGCKNEPYRLEYLMQVLAAE
jgi:hypothetical protein